MYKIIKIVVGTHFFQTDPDFIKMFIGEKGVRFFKNQNELFYPKLYIFKRGGKKIWKKTKK